MRELSSIITGKVVSKVETALAKYTAAARVKCRARKVFNNLRCRIMRLVEISVFVFVKGELIQQRLPRPPRSGSSGV